MRNRFVQKRLSRPALKLFLGYLVGFYVFPQIFLLFFEERITAYNLSNIYLGWVILLMPFLLILCAELVPNLKIKTIYLFRYLYGQGVVSLFSCLFLILSIYYFLNYSIRFRHVGAGLSSDYLLIIHYFLRSYFNAYLVVILLHTIGGCERPKFLRLISIIVISGNLLSLNSSLQIVYISGYLVMSFLPHLLKVRGLKILYVGFIGLVIVSNVIILGLANKVGGYSAALEFLGHNADIFVLLGQRLSTMQISLIYYLNDLDLQTSMAVFFDEFIYNFDNINILLGGEKSYRSDPWSINRLNFLNISRAYNVDAGTSPGLLGSLIMLWPLCIVLLCYVVYILRLLSSFKLDFGPLGGFFAVILILYPLFLSPLSLINVFSTLTINTILILSAINYSLKS